LLSATRNIKGMERRVVATVVRLGEDEIRGLISGMDGCPCLAWAGGKVEEEPG